MGDAEDDAERARASRRYDELHHQLQHQDAYSVDHRVEEILAGLGFASVDFSAPRRRSRAGNSRA